MVFASGDTGIASAFEKKRQHQKDASWKDLTECLVALPAAAVNVLAVSELMAVETAAAAVAIFAAVAVLPAVGYDFAAAWVLVAGVAGAIIAAASYLAD